MDQGLLPRRYAKALYKFALEHNDQSNLYNAMKLLADNFDAAPELQKAVANPFLDESKKEQLIIGAAGNPAPDKGGKALADFVRLLLRNRRIALVRQTALAYRDIYREENSIYQVTVTSAVPLDQKDRQRLADLVKTRLGGGTAEIQFEVDPDIIGGFVITIDNDRLDASVRSELDSLSRKLLG